MGTFSSTSNIGHATMNFPTTFSEIFMALVTIDNISKAGLSSNWAWCSDLAIASMTIAWDSKNSFWSAFGTKN